MFPALPCVLTGCVLRHVCFFFAILVFLVVTTPLAAENKQGTQVIETTPDKIRADCLDIIFSGQESLHYSISWKGGIKIGDLSLNIYQEANGEFVIDARVVACGLFGLIFPINDIFTTRVQGELKLPVQYDVLQRESRRRPTKRHFIYDQHQHTVRYKKNETPVQYFTIAGTAYNEFSAFFITRALRYSTFGVGIVVPAFVDKKRHEVIVSMLRREHLKNTLFGDVTTMKVKPAMNFKGLYNKNGNTSIWLTDDVCRIPIIIDSRIVVGSLTAKLVEYTNPACPLPQYQLKKEGVSNE